MNTNIATEKKIVHFLKMAGVTAENAWKPEFFGERGGEIIRTFI